MNMHKKLLLTSFCATVLIGWTARAADLSSPQPQLQLPPAFTWTGIYGGGQVGYAWAPDDFNFVGFDPVSRLLVNGIIRNNPNGVIGGAHLGAQVQFNQTQLVLGIEGSVDGTSLNSTNAVATIPNVFKGSQFSASLSDEVQGSIRGKIGIAWDRFLVYGTGGVSFGGFSTDFELTASTRHPPFFAAATTSSTRTGWTAGGGIQYAVGGSQYDASRSQYGPISNWWYFIEYRFTDFGTLQNSLLANELPAGAFFNGNRRLQENQVQAGFSYRFDLWPPAQPVVAKY
jgi:outer membrane immunogenic protein